MKIALLKPAASDDRVGEALGLFDSMVWASRGATKSTWSTSAPTEADAVVVHHSESVEVIAHWRSNGKIVVVVNTDPSRAIADNHYTVVYPFSSKQVKTLLDKIDVETNTGSFNGSAKGESQSVRGGVGLRPWTFGEALQAVRTAPNPNNWFLAKNDGAPLLWFRGDGAKYQCTAGIGFALQRGRLPLNSVEVLLSDPAKGMIEHSGEELCWHIGYYLNPSFAPWVRENSTYRLRRWPDLGRWRGRDFTTTTTQLRVVAALDALPSKPAVIARRARVTKEQAARTVNALSLGGFIEVEELPQHRAARTVYAPTQPTGGLRNFFRNLRKHLQGRSGE